MRTFQAYFDCSGAPDDTAAVVVAGFIAPEAQWAHFDRNWRNCLDDFGVSALHMKHFAHSRGDFLLWKGDEERRRRFIARLISIIRTRVWHSFASAVVMADYRAVDLKYRLSEFSKPFTLAACSCIAKVEKWRVNWASQGDSIAYMFEDGDADKGDLIRAAQMHYGLKPSFLRKSASVAFQAADLLAYEHLMANKKFISSISNEVFEVFENELRYPLRELSSVPGARTQDWGVHKIDDMTDSCVRDEIALRA